MSNNSSAVNSTIPCTLQTCPLSDAIVTYQPSVGGNGFFAALFGGLLISQVVYGIRFKTWTFLVAMIFGLVLEIVGYIGRIQLHSDPFNFNYFLEYLIPITIGPAFFTAAIYVTFARVVYSCDETVAWIRPKIISITFMTCDFICLVLQATGGAITSTSNGETQSAMNTRQTGVNIMIGGLSFQVVSLFFFMVYAAFYAWRWRAAKAMHCSSQTRTAHAGLRWNALVYGLGIASVTIFVRCCFRVAELRNGFGSSLANNEVAFMILEGAMVSIACLCLTVAHPGVCLDTPWKLPKRKMRNHEERGSNVKLRELNNKV